RFNHNIRIYVSYYCFLPESWESAYGYCQTWWPNVDCVINHVIEGTRNLDTYFLYRPIFILKSCIQVTLDTLSYFLGAGFLQHWIRRGQRAAIHPFYGFYGVGSTPTTINPNHCFAARTHRQMQISAVSYEARS